MSKSYPQLFDREWLRLRHHDDGLNHAEIARLVGCSVPGARTALIRHGLYQPKRRPRELRILGHVSREQMLTDAAMVSSWSRLAMRYGTGRAIVMDHALYLDILPQVAARFRPLDRRQPLSHHPLLVSRDWIATAWGRSYRLRHVADLAGVSEHVLSRWLRLHDMSSAELRLARDGAIVAEYLDGAMLAHVSDRYDLDQAAVFRILRGAGVDTSTRKVRRRRTA